MDKRRRLELDIAALTWIDFQRLVHDLVKKEHPDALPLDTPDGGADSLIPAMSEDPKEAVQAKHYPRPGRINWTHCANSLTTALGEHTPGRVTFVFSRDFNKNDERMFRQKLVDPNPSVEIRARTLDHVIDLLERHPDVKTRYFGRDREDVLDSILRAVEQGGKLQSGPDLIERARSLGEFTAEHDKDFDYTTTSGGGSLPEPSWGELEEPFMSMRVEDETVFVRVDAWAREGVQASKHFGFTEDEAGEQARAQAREELAAGRAVTFMSGVEVTIMNAPKVMRESIGEVHTPEITIQPGGAMPVEIELTAANGETTKYNWGFRAVPPTEPGHIAFAYADDGLFLELDFTALEEPSVRFKFDATGRFRSDVTSNVAAARFLHGFFTHQHVVFRGEGLFPPDGLEGDPLVGYETSARVMAARLAIYEDLELIEKRCGVDFDIPGSVPEDQLDVIVTAASILRTGTGRATFHGGEGIVAAADIPSVPQRIQAKPHVRAIEYAILGERVNLGMAEYQLPPLKVVEVIPHGTRPDAPARVKVEADGGDQMPFRLLQEDPELSDSP